MFKGDPLFSGQEAESYIVFPALDPDVESFVVNVSDVAVRFDYKGEPVETIDLSFRFEREVHKGYQPPAEWLSDIQ